MVRKAESFVLFALSYGAVIAFVAGGFYMM